MFSMKLHEYQAKQLFASAQIPVPRGRVAQLAEEAASAYTALKQACGNPDPFVCNVKAQVHAGGRGKAGGILIAKSAQEATAHARQLLSRRLVTAQTGPEGLPVSAVLLEERLALARELYLALTLDRFDASPMLLASHLGGMDIEAVAVSQPKALIREPVAIDAGPTPAVSARLAAALGCSDEQGETLARVLAGLWQLFLRCDAALIEVNPLVITEEKRLVALDAKMTLDDNALFRHPELAALRDERQEHPLELEAARIGISYVGLSGTIGCLVNGAGLAMATNDIITLAGGEPANFLDVGGGANVEQVTKAFGIILRDSRVNAILVNIFGGIMRCDWIAQGLLNASQALQVKVPVVVRLQGTNVEEGRRLLRQSQGLKLVSADELAEAAHKAVELAR